MIGTLSMIALVVVGAYGITPLVILPFAVGNAMVGLGPLPDLAGDTDARRVYWAGFKTAIPMQLLFTGTGYALGYVFSYLVERLF